MKTVRVFSLLILVLGSILQFTPRAVATPLTPSDIAHIWANDGDLGWLPRKVGVIPAEVEAIAFALQPGKISGPIETASSFYIIKLEKKEANRPLTKKMVYALKKQIFTDWLIEQRSSTAIEKYVAL